MRGNCRIKWPLWCHILTIPVTKTGHVGATIAREVLSVRAAQCKFAIVVPHFYHPGIGKWPCRCQLHLRPSVTTPLRTLKRHNAAKLWRDAMSMRQSATNGGIGVEKWSERGELVAQCRKIVAQRNEYEAKCNKWWRRHKCDEKLLEWCGEEQSATNGSGGGGRGRGEVTGR